MMPPRAAALAALLALAACGTHRREPEIARAWVRLPAVAGGAAAAYFTLRGGAHANRLLRVESAVATRAEMHENMRGTGSMSGMRPLAAVEVPVAGEVSFAPGGRHVMLFGLDPRITAGTAVPLRFGFADGSTAEAEAKSVPAGADAPY